jgi:uncharacterized membrane protein
MIEQYLGALRNELAGEDPALVQDALYDADEYLRTEIEGAQDPQAAFEAAVQRYGSPQEIADAYREAEITVERAMSGAPKTVPDSRGPAARFFGVVADPKAWGALFYLLLAFATGLVYFIVTTVWLSVSAALTIIVIGVVLLALFLPVIRAISFMEGRMVEALLGERMPRRPRPFNRQAGLGARVKSWLTDRRTWTTLAYMVLQFPLGLLYFVTLVTVGSTCVALVLLPVAQAFGQAPVVWVGDYGYALHPAAMPLAVLAGLVGLIVMLHAVRGVGRLHAQYAKAMLVGDFADTGTTTQVAA